jgi:phospholipid/cholesterol/gamma-HCH transport system substrate-binding protein
MTRRGIEIRVGALVVIAAVIAVVGTMWFQRFQFAEKRYPISVRFTEVGGPIAGDPVHVNGVERGKVQGVELAAPGEVVVELGIREGVAVPVDSRIVLKSIGIMGERFVSITQGTSPQMLQAGETIDGQFLMGMSEVMGSAGDILSDVQAAAQSLREVADMLTAQGRLQETMDNLADVSGSLRDVTTGEDAAVIEAIERFNHVATLMDSLVTTHYASMDSSMAAFGRAGGRIEVVADNIAAISDDLKSISQALRDQEGTAGRLIYDDELIRRLEHTVTSVDSLIIDMKLHPGRYVTFKIF